MDHPADYTFLYLALLLLPVFAASCIWMADRFGFHVERGLDARLSSVELLLHNEIKERTVVCGQIGSAVREVVTFLRKSQAEKQPFSERDSAAKVNSDSAAETHCNSAREIGKKPKKIKAKAKARKSGVPRGNVTPFPHGNKRKPRTPEVTSDV